MPAASFLVLRAGKFAHSYLNFRRSMMTWLSGPHLTLGWVDSRTRIRVVPAEWSTLIGPDCPDTVLWLVEPYYASAKGYAITTHK